jgi:hypothetical protein
MQQTAAATAAPQQKHQQHQYQHLHPQLRTSASKRKLTCVVEVPSSLPKDVPSITSRL